MTLILKLDLDIVKMYLHTKNEVSMSKGSKVITEHANRQTDRQTWPQTLAIAYTGGNFYWPQQSWAKVMFLQACLILFTGGSTWAGTPPGPGTPPRTRYTPKTRYTPRTMYTHLDQVHPLGSGTPPDQVPPGPSTPPGTRYTPQDQVHPRDQVHPPGPGTTPRTRYPPPPKIRSTSGRYASYWNAFLLKILFGLYPLPTVSDMTKQSQVDFQ